MTTSEHSLRMNHDPVYASAYRAALASADNAGFDTEHRDVLAFAEITAHIAAIPSAADSQPEAHTEETPAPEAQAEAGQADPAPDADPAPELMQQALARGVASLNASRGGTRAEPETGADAPAEGACGATEAGSGNGQPDAVASAFKKATASINANR